MGQRPSGRAERPSSAADGALGADVPVLVDSHCHLGDARFDDDRAAVLARARAAGVAHVVVIAESACGTARAADLARTHGLAATAGVHPHEAASWDPGVAAAIEAALADPVVVAVGETGLDYHYDHSPREVQRRVFEAHLELAARHRKPVVVHAREADGDVAAMVRAWARQVPAVILHSFSSGAPLRDAGLEVGAYFSFSGMITFSSWSGGDAVRACPDDRLLVETDAPYLAPHPRRGTRNEPSYVRYVAARVAEIRAASVEHIARRTTMNAARCFGLRLAAGAAAEP